MHHQNLYATHSNLLKLPPRSGLGASQPRRDPLIRVHEGGLRATRLFTPVTPNSWPQTLPQGLDNMNTRIFQGRERPVPTLIDPAPCPNSVPGNTKLNAVHTRSPKQIAVFFLFRLRAPSITPRDQLAPRWAFHNTPGRKPIVWTLPPADGLLRPRRFCRLSSQLLPSSSDHLHAPAAALQRAREPSPDLRDVPSGPVWRRPAASAVSLETAG